MRFFAVKYVKKDPFYKRVSPPAGGPREAFEEDGFEEDVVVVGEVPRELEGQVVHSRGHQLGWELDLDLWRVGVGG
jgi:hypothetical protein